MYDIIIVFTIRVTGVLYICDCLKQIQQNKWKLYAFILRSVATHFLSLSLKVRHFALSWVHCKKVWHYTLNKGLRDAITWCVLEERSRCNTSRTSAHKCNSAASGLLPQPSVGLMRIRFFICCTLDGASPELLGMKLQHLLCLANEENIASLITSCRHPLPIRTPSTHWLARPRTQ